MNSGEVGVITYSSVHYDSTPLRCCLAHDEWRENPEACITQEDEEFTYTYNDPICTKDTCTRTNLYMPNSGLRDLVLVLAGDMCAFTRTETVSPDICC